MVAKHARHQMREDKNFKGTDPSEITAQYLYCDLDKGFRVLRNLRGSPQYFEKCKKGLFGMIRQLGTFT